MVLLLTVIERVSPPSALQTIAVKPKTNIDKNNNIFFTKKHFPFNFVYYDYNYIKFKGLSISKLKHLSVKLKTVYFQLFI